MNRTQNLVPEGPDHPRARVLLRDRIWRLQSVDARGLKSESRIVAGMTEHEGQHRTPFGQFIQSCLDEFTANSLALTVGNDRQGRQDGGGNAGGGLNPNPGEKDMADGPALFLRQYGNDRPGARIGQQFDGQPGFFGAAEGLFVNGENTLEVVVAGGPEQR